MNAESGQQPDGVSARTVSVAETSEPRLDLSASWGVVGWIWQGRHYRLAEMVELLPEREEWLRRRHAEGMLLLGLCQLHLRYQAEEVSL